MKNNKQISNVAIYVRGSKESVEQQLEICNTYLKENKLGLYQVYNDENVSGVQHLEELNKALSNKKLDYIVVSSFLRLGRTQEQHREEINKATANNINIILLDSIVFNL